MPRYVDANEIISEIRDKIHILYEDGEADREVQYINGMLDAIKIIEEAQTDYYPNCGTKIDGGSNEPTT